MEFKIGDVVRWESQSIGSSKIKTGKVVAVLKYKAFGCVGSSIRRLAAYKFPNHRRMFEGWSMPCNQDVAYFIEVKDGKTERAKPKLYLPDPRRLRLASNE
jgi:hypothetical protein